MPCRIAGSMLGFCPLDARSSLHPVTVKKVSRRCQMSPSRDGRALTPGWEWPSLPPFLADIRPGQKPLWCPDSVSSLCFFLPLCSMPAHLLGPLFSWGRHLLLTSRGQSLHIPGVSAMLVSTSVTLSLFVSCHRATEDSQAQSVGC